MVKLKHPDVGIFLLRLFVGLRLVYGVIDNMVSWDKMVEFSQFLDSFQFPLPLISAIVSVYIQFIGGLCILLGYKIRFVSLVLIINFLVAIIFVHIAAGHSIEATTPALAMLFGCLCLIFTGAGKFAINKKI